MMCADYYQHDLIGPPRHSTYSSIRLYCFPYAGGEASLFRRWQDKLPPHIHVHAVELPGRGLKAAMQPVGDYRTLIQMLATELAGDFHQARSACPGLGYAIFGHGAGARFGFRVASLLERWMMLAPVRCLFSGTKPPHCADRELPRTNPNGEQWIVRLCAAGGVPPDILADPEWMRAVLPFLRADLDASEGSRIDTTVRLACPFTLMAADRDALASPQDVWSWSRYTYGPSHRALLEGDHFSVFHNPMAILDWIRAEFPAPSITGAC